MFPGFSPCVINLSRNKNTCCGLKKVVVHSRARVYFEQQILALLLVFHQTHNLSRNKFVRALANQPISTPHFFNLQQMFLSRVKLITQGEKRKTSTKTCNETMLKVFVSRISPPLQVGLFTQVCHWIGLHAIYKPFAKIQRANERVNQILYEERCVKEQIYFELLNVSAFSSPVRISKTVFPCISCKANHSTELDFSTLNWVADNEEIR